MRIFSGLMAGFLALTAGTALADNYRLRPGDTVDLTVWQDQKLNRQAVVAPDGVITFPLVGHIKAGGLTTVQAESLIKSKLQPKYVEDLDVSVSYIQSPKKDAPTTPKKEHEWTVFVTGEVAKPGAFVVPNKNLTALQAIALSGGVGPFGANKRIQIHRKTSSGEYVYEFNYALYEKGKNLDGNIALRDGDVIVVPEKKLFE
jgi:polysaccharide biosynthesis/export protein